FSSRRRHTRFSRDWSSDVCSSDLVVFEYRTQPERGTPEVFDVVEVFRDALYGATTGAVELFGIAKALLFPPSRSRHAIVVIVKPVDHKEVNKFLAPVSGAIGPVLFPGLGG